MIENTDQKADAKLGQKYEVVFSVFLVILAFLWRQNPNFTYPQILYSFIVFLTLNLVVGLSLRFWPSREWISALIILANCGTITAIISYSGGQDFYLWVLYLLPIYTVCLLLSGREVSWITTGVLSFNSIFYASSPYRNPIRYGLETSQASGPVQDGCI